MTPVYGFMIADLARSLAALCLFPLFIFVPGYVLAWLSDLLAFRQRSAAFQIAFSVPLSISISPILIYLAGRLVSMHAVWVVFAGVWVVFLGIAARQAKRFALSRSARPFAIAMALWAILALFSLVDLQLGQKVYFSTVA